jgi:hypothetical protein
MAYSISTYGYKSPIESIVLSTYGFYPYTDVVIEDTNPISDYFQALYTKLSLCSYITDTNNILIGESVDLLSLSDTEFPRLEVLTYRDIGLGYKTDRKIDFGLHYCIVGYAKDVSIEYMTEFGVEVRCLNFQFIDDKILGNSPCHGFISLYGYPELFVREELFGGIYTFMLFMSATIQFLDTRFL